MTSVDAPREAGHRERADFGIVWFGQGISSVGTAVTSLALPLVAITTLHASGWQVAMLTAATYAPSAILALPAGVWLDRRSRRPVVLLADLGRGVALATIPIAAALGVLTVTQLILVALVVGAFSVFFDVAYQSWLPSVVPRDRLLRANGLLGATDAAGRLSGPGLGGALVSIIGGARTLWIDAISFAIAAAATSLVRAREAALTVSTIKAPLSRELTTGLVWLRHARPLRYLVAATSWMNLFAAIWITVETLFLIRTLHESAWITGLVLALGSGGIIGGLASSRIATRFGDARAVVSSAAVAGPLALIAPLATGLLGPWAVSVGLFGVTLTGAISSACTMSYRQHVVPTGLLGRVSSAIRLISFAAIPLGAVLGGALVSITTPRIVLIIAAIGYGSAVCWLAPIWATRTLPVSDP